MSSKLWKCIVAVMLGVLASGVELTDAAERPNFVLCMADDLGWGDVAYNGNRVVQTPILDELARTAVRFDRFYAAHNVCSPTRAAFLTGRTPVRAGVFSWGWSLPPEEITLAEALQTAGYATGHFGKWHLGTLHARSATSPGGQGFDTWLSSPNFYENDPLFSRQGTVVETKGESSAVTVDAALTFIEAAVQKRQPFAAVVWFGNPHVPHEAREELQQLYPGQPANMQNYWGEITGIDRAMAKLRQRLRTLGIADNTLLLFTSDNGATKPGSAGDLRGAKGTNYEGGLRVPTLLEWPGRIKAPRVITTPCCTVDILPTVLAAAGVEHPRPDRPLDGVDIMPIVEGRLTDRPTPLGFWTYPIRGQGMKSRDLLVTLREQVQGGQADALPPISPAEQKAFATQYPSRSFPGHAVWIDGRFKLHRIPRDGGEDSFTLYDLEADRQEMNDLAASESQRVATMMKQLQAWQQSVLDSLNGKDYSPR